MRILILILGVFWFTGHILCGQSATDIVQKSLDLVTGQSNEASMKMTIIRPTWQREIEIKSWSYGTEYSLVLITAPARDAGTVFLKRQSELWNWQPNIERTIKMPPSMMLQSWMGSDFTNDDLVRQSSIVEDYNHELLAEEVIEGYPCYKIELEPKPDAPVVWGKVLAWIDKEHYMTLKNEFYDEDGFIVNTMYGKDVKIMDGRLIPAVLDVIPAESPDQKTIIEYLSIDFDTDIEPAFFSIQNMKRIR